LVNRYTGNESIILYDWYYSLGIWNQLSWTKIKRDDGILKNLYWGGAADQRRLRLRPSGAGGRLTPKRHEVWSSLRIRGRAKP